MPARISILYRVVQSIRIPVQRLRIIRIRKQRIRLNENPVLRRIISCTVVHQTGIGIIFLPCKPVFLQTA